MGSLIDIINTKIDYQYFYSQYISGKLKISGSEISSRCPFHEDETPSFSFNVTTGQWHCHANCGSGNVFTFIQKAENLSKKEATKFIIDKLNIKISRSKKSESKKKIISESVYMKYHDELIQNSKVKKWLKTKRGLNIDTIQEYVLGFYKNSITIPIFDEFNNCVNIRYYNPQSKTSKFQSYKTGYGEARIYPYQNLKEQSIIICEGEMDCLLLNQLGFPAITVTSGAGVWKSYWSSLFEQKTVYVCYDVDEKGKTGAIKILDYLLKYTSKLYNIELPIKTPSNADITDFFITHEKTVNDFKGLIRKTKEYRKSNNSDDIIYTNIELADASEAKNYFKHFEMKVLVVGKDLSPYLVPQKVKFICDQSLDPNKCGVCPLGFAGGGKIISFDLNTSQILEMIQISKSQLDMYIRKISGIISSCTRYIAEILKAMNVEEIRLIPDIDYQNDEQKYVVRQAYFLGHGIESNKVYIIRGITLPEPKTQYATHMILEIEKAQDSIDTFKMTPQLKEELKIFQPT